MRGAWIDELIDALKKVIAILETREVGIGLWWLMLGDSMEKVNSIWKDGTDN